jgi:hypothetical protein
MGNNSRTENLRPNLVTMLPFLYSNLVGSLEFSKNFFQLSEKGQVVLGGKHAAKSLLPQTSARKIQAGEPRSLGNGPRGSCSLSIR